MAQAYRIRQAGRSRLGREQARRRRRGDGTQATETASRLIVAGP